MFFGNTFLKLPNRVLLSNCFFTNFHFNAKFEGSVSALEGAKTEFDDAITALYDRNSDSTSFVFFGDLQNEFENKYFEFDISTLRFHIPTFQLVDVRLN